MPHAQPAGGGLGGATPSHKGKGGVWRGAGLRLHRPTSLCTPSQPPPALLCAPPLPRVLTQAAWTKVNVCIIEKAYRAYCSRKQVLHCPFPQRVWVPACLPACVHLCVCVCVCVCACVCPRVTGCSSKLVK